MAIYLIINKLYKRKDKQTIIDIDGFELNFLIFFMKRVKKNFLWHNNYKDHYIVAAL